METRQYFNDSESEEEYIKTRVKSNSINTLKKFYNPSVELVNTLEFRKLLLKKEERYKLNNKSVVEKKNENKFFKGKYRVKSVKFKTQFLNTLVEERLENINKESDLEKKIKIIENNIKELEREMNKIIGSISDINKSIEEKFLMIDCFSHMELVDNEKLSSLSPIKKKKLSEEKLFSIRKISLSRDRENEECKDELSKFKLMKMDQYEEYKELERKLQSKRHELKDLKYKLMNHYHNLLHEGKDTR